MKINNIKKTYICKDIDNYIIDRIDYSKNTPKVGDVCIFEVVSIGKHTQIQGADKRNCNIFPGDYIMAVFGNRYATEQFEGYVPEFMLENFHILGAGGTIGIVASTHSKFEKVGPTVVKIIGQATDNVGNVINTIAAKKHKMVSYNNVMQSLTRVILSIGSSMDSGKTTTAAHIVKGLTRKGFSTGFVKLTGTVYTKDCDLNMDHGATVSIDFSNFGYPSTYMCKEQELLNIYESALTAIKANELDYVVMEIADGIFQRETEMLLNNRTFINGIDSIVFSANDSLSAVQGVKTLQDFGIRPSALGGLFTASPLLIKEVKNKVDVPIYTIQEFALGSFSKHLEIPLSYVC